MMSLATGAFLLGYLQRSYPAIPHDAQSLMLNLNLLTNVPIWVFDVATNMSEILCTELYTTMYCWIVPGDTAGYMWEDRTIVGNQNEVCLR